MSTIIILTDFSDSSRNALQYAASFSCDRAAADLLLLNIYTVPPSYSGEALSLAAVRDAVADSGRLLQEELEWAQGQFPGISFRHRAVAGNFIASLQEQISQEQAGLLVMGSPAGYGEMNQWDVDSLHALTDLTIPVLTVPRAVQYHPILHIAFACLPSTIDAHSPFAAIRQLLAVTGAQLHVVTVEVPGQAYQEGALEGISLLHGELQEPGTAYHSITETHVVNAIAHFVEEQHIDLLLVMPGRHGLWYNLFHKSHTRQLARLNLIPVIALHGI